MRPFNKALFLATLLASSACGAHAAVRGSGGGIGFEAVNPPQSGFVSFVAERDHQNLEVRAKWSRTASTCMHFRDTVTLELLDASGGVIQSVPAEFAPQIRTRGCRDKVWVLRHEFAPTVAQADKLRVRFDRREY